MIQSLKYSCLVQHQISITNLVENRLFFNFLLTPFRKYNGKVVNFIYNGNKHSGIYKYTYNELSEIQHYLEIDVTKFVEVPPVDTTINVYDSFLINKDNELVTTQDIHDLFKPEMMELSLIDGKISVENTGKSGLVSDFDYNKLSSIPVLVKSTNDLTLNNTFQNIITFEEKSSSNYSLLLSGSNGILDAEISFDNNDDNHLLIKINHCSFKTDDNLMFSISRLKFIEGKYIKLSLSISTENQYKFSFGSPSIEALIIPTTSSIEEPITFNNESSIVLDSTVLSLSSKLIQKVPSAIDLQNASITSNPLISDVTIPGTEIIAGMNLGGLNLDGFVKKLVQRTYYPSYVAPSVTLVASGIVANVEVGTIGNLTLTTTLNRGSIVGNVVSNLWNATSIQNPRSGLATKYTFDGIDNLVNPVKTLTNVQIASGVNTWNVSVNYAEGPQPKDSKGNNYQTPLVAGSLTKAVSINGYRNCFYGTDNLSAEAYTTSAQIRSLPNVILNPIAGTTFIITIPVGAKKVVIVYPGTLRDISSIKYVEASNTEVKGIFTKTNVDVNGVNDYLAVSNKVYTYIPVSPFTQSVHYTVTI